MQSEKQPFECIIHAKRQRYTVTYTVRLINNYIGAAYLTFHSHGLTNHSRHPVMCTSTLARTVTATVVHS